MTYEERRTLREAIHTFAKTVGEGQFDSVQRYDAAEAAIAVNDMELDLGTTWLLAAFLLHCCNAAAEANDAS